MKQINRYFPYEKVISGLTYQDPTQDQLGKNNITQNPSKTDSHPHFDSQLRWSGSITVGGDR